LLAVIVAKAQIGSDFSVDADGWKTYNASTTLSTAATYVGGNITDGGINSGVILYAEAPGKFLGNRSFSYNQDFSFQLKTDFVGSDNTNGDIIIIGAGGTLFYQLTPAKPGTSFTAYTVKLSETFAGWHFNGIANPPPTQPQMKSILSNITSIRIRTKYITSNTFTVTGSLDNVVMNVASLPIAPTITSFTPASGFLRWS